MPGGEVAHYETRERLLDAAEVLFANDGFESVSLRAITNSANANVASVNYHFGGKENLINAVMVRHATPVNEERVRRIELLLEREVAPSVREVLEAFLSPLFDRIRSHENNEKLFGKFMGRMIGEGAKGLPEEVIPSFVATLGKVVQGLMQAMPGLTEGEAYLRLKFCFAVMGDAMMQDETFTQIAGERLSDWDFERLFEAVLNFCEGGLQKR